nr:retrovirus-related Pol polyprotein from transposon TNT 1-94 [Tanacetum cinerariifolium]
DYHGGGEAAVVVVVWRVDGDSGGDCGGDFGGGGGAWGIVRNCVSISTAKSEYVVVSSCCAQVLWMRTQLTDYGFFYDNVPIYCDSKSAIAISCNPVHHTRTKNIDVRYHFIKDHVEKGTIELYFVGTEYQLADLFTKSLPEVRFKFLVEKLGMMRDDSYSDAYSIIFYYIQHTTTYLHFPIMTTSTNLTTTKVSFNLHENDSSSLRLKISFKIDKDQVAQNKVKKAFENDDSSSRVELIPSKIKYANKCKKQIVVATSTTEAEYVAIASCYGQDCAKVKTVNEDVQIRALVDGKKIIVTEAYIGRDLQIQDAEELIKKEKEGLDSKLSGFQIASKDLDNLLESQRLDKNKEGLGYSVVPPPPAQVYSPPKKDMSWIGLPEFADDTITDYTRPSPSVESNPNDLQNSRSSGFENGESTDSILSKLAIKFVKAVDRPAERPTTNKVKTTKKSTVKYAEL